MKNQYLRSFLQRGLAFGGFGPVICGIVFLILGNTLDSFTLTGNQVFWAILSTYILAFLQAGASVFNQIEHWPLPKSLLCHFLTVYLAYIGCYLLNTWIPFEMAVILIFTAIFVVSYFLIWTIVFFSVKSVTKKLNNKLK